MYTTKWLYLLIFIVVLSSCSKEDNSEFETIPFEEQILEDSSYFLDGDVEVVFENNPTNGVNVIYVGEGYLNTDLGMNTGQYRIKAKSDLNYIFSKEPFASYSEDFNVYIVYATSEESPESITEAEEENMSTAFNLRPGNNGYIWDDSTLESYIQNAIGNNTQDRLVIMGTKFQINGQARLGRIAFGSAGNNETILHEVGHAFGRLGDEYENNFPNPDLYPNQDDTNDLSKIEWSHFIGQEGYDIVGAYFHSPGVWIPQPYSVMGLNDFSENFNAPSREAIVKRIKQIKGEEYSFDEFLLKDIHTNTFGDYPESNNSSRQSHSRPVCEGIFK